MTHTIRWIHDRDTIQAEMTCSDVEGRIESFCTVVITCRCDDADIKHDERGYFHTAIEFDGDDEIEVRHDMPHNPDTAECTLALWMDGQWEELFDGVNNSEVHSGEIEFTWHGYHYTWRYVR